MRIIAGIAKGRRLFSPPSVKGGNAKIRPTADRAREALFNVLAGHTSGARVLDLCAGSGALGLEALSRGAEQALFVDSSRIAVALIAKNIQACGFEFKSTIVKRDLTKGLFFLAPYCPEGFSLVFADPPYKKKFLNTILGDLGKGGVMCSTGIVVAEASSKENLPETLPGLTLIDQRSYGEAGFWIYRKE